MKHRTSPRPYSFRPSFEQLEERALLSVSPADYAAIAACPDLNLPAPQEAGNITTMEVDLTSETNAATGPEISNNLPAAPAGYAESDFYCLQSFLEQTDSSGVKNGTKLNASYSSTDPTTWMGVTWQVFDGVKRLRRLGVFGPNRSPAPWIFPAVRI